jgi:drug/metabolite transporter (DMT)-like permease
MNIAMLPLLIGIFLNASAQLLLKAGMERVGYFAFNWNNLIPIGLKVAFNPFIIIGLGCYVFSVVAWLMALSRVDVGFAYPMLSLAYIVTAIAGYFLLQENLSLIRIAGIVVILAGVFLISRSA